MDIEVQDLWEKRKPGEILVWIEEDENDDEEPV